MDNTKRYLQTTIGIFVGLSIAGAPFGWFVAWFLVGWMFFPVEKKKE